MINVSRIAHITLETPDMDRQLDYYQRVLGLTLLDRNADRAWLTAQVGEIAVVLERGDVAACRQLAFQVAPDTDFDATRKFLSDEGIASDICSDSRPLAGQVLAFTDINGTRIELFTRPDFHRPDRKTGISPFKLGHVAFIVDDPVASADFYSRIMGFRVSDWVEKYFVFMRCGPDHHTVNFLKAEGRRMHHFAFELRDSAELLRSCEILGQEKLEILWGPVRHGPGHNIATYHQTSDGLIVELYTELDQMTNEELGYFNPRPWHEDLPQRPKTWVGGGPRDVWGPRIPENFLLQGD